MESQLEPRLLTRPAFYRRPNVAAWVNAMATNGPSVTNDSTAGTGGVLEARITPPWPFLPAVVYRQAGQATTQIVDSAVPSAGVFGISASFTHDHSMSVGSNVAGFAPPVNFNFITAASGTRGYLLADEGTIPPIQQTATLVETLSFTMTQAGNAPFVILGGMGFEGLRFNVAAVYPALPQVTAIDPGTTVVTSTSNGGGISTFRLTATTVYLGGLPRFPDGVPEDVVYGSNLNTQMLTASDANSRITIALNYEAHFVV